MLTYIANQKQFGKRIISELRAEGFNGTKLGGNESLLSYCETFNKNNSLPDASEPVSDESKHADQQDQNSCTVLQVMVQLPGHPAQSQQADHLQRAEQTADALRGRKRGITGRETLWLLLVNGWLLLNEKCSLGTLIPAQLSCCFYASHFYICTHAVHMQNDAGVPSPFFGQLR